MSAEDWSDARESFGCALAILGYTAAVVAFGLLFRAIDWALS